MAEFLPLIVYSLIVTIYCTYTKVEKNIEWVNHFFISFAKGHNFCDFLIAFEDDTALPKYGSLLHEII